MEHKILTPELSTATDLRQRRLKVVAPGLKSMTSVSGAGDADDGSVSPPAVSSTRSLWFYRVRFCVSLVVILACAWAYASYVKQLHETRLWFSNIQVMYL